MPPPMTPQPFNAAQLLNTELPDPVWAVPGLLPEGLTLLAGRPKIGKSWLALHVAMAIASGGVVLGKIHVEQGSVLYLALEDNKRRIKSRLLKLLGPMGTPADVELLHFETSWPRLDQGGAEALAKWLEDNPITRLFVLDTLAKVRPSPKSGESAYQFDYDCMAALKGVADKSGVPGLVLTHVRKQSAEDVFDTVSGTLGLTGAADATMVLERKRAHCDGVLHVTGRDMDEQELALGFDKQYGLWSLLGNAKDYQATQEEAKVLAALAKHGVPMKPAELAEELEKTVAATKVLLGRMYHKGLLIKPTMGLYALATVPDA